MKLWMLRWLPQGRVLPEATWQTRHRVVIALALAQAVLLAVGSALWGPDPRLAAWHGLMVAGPALLALPGWGGRHVRSSLATLSLMAASMMLIYLWNGQTEGHFHFFVMIAVVALYQDWAPFGTALVAVLAHHGILGTVLPHDVFGHHGAHTHPWLWAGIHAAFVLAASIASLTAWRLNEQVLLRDALTGLASRTLFGELVASASRRGEDFGIVFIDLDDFKSVNDTHGHDTGDRLLEAVGGRLAGCLRSTDTLARLGGDEFAALVHGTPLQAELAATRMLATMDDPIVIEGLSLHVTASLGVATHGAGTGSVGTTSARVAALQRDADVAMYAAKERGKHRVAIYVEGMDESVRRRSNLQQDLRLAVAEGQIEVHYQPVVELDTGEMTGCEALARWTHPEAGAISPTEFIPWAEATGTIVELGVHVMGRAIAWASAISERTARPVQIAVNVSPTQLVAPSFVSTVEDMLRRHALPADRLVLEITENTMTEDPERAIAVLAEIRALGVRVAVDDFGTGFANLSYLQRLPADIIKIDRSFVADLGADTTSVALVSSIIQLAHALGMQVVAEGVETVEQRDVLMDLGCAVGQGFLFARPSADPAPGAIVRPTDPEVAGMSVSDGVPDPA